jgi:hypothetical protein
MGEYLVSNITYPATQYEPTEEPPTGTPVYHEDREVTLSATTGSQMFRTYNAQFNPDTVEWGFPEGASAPAYATVQNPDGSIHYFTNQSGATTWTTWAGSGNNNVYNAVDYGLSTTGVGIDNTAALNAAVTAAINAGGGTIFIPQGSYDLSGPVSIDASGTAGVIIAGVSGLTELVQTAAYDIFDVTASGKDCGIRFRDLRLRYNQPSSSGLFAVNITGSDSVTCERVTFKDCPGSFKTDSNCEFCGLFDCYIDYGATTADDGSPLNSQTMVSLSGVEDFVAQCVIFQSNNATDCIGISFLANNNAYFVSNTHIADIYTGITITGGGPEGLNGIYVSAVLINAVQNAVIIEPSVAGHTIHDIHFTNCTFAATNDSGMQTSGVQINIPSGGLATDVASIYFTGCSAYGWGNAGIEVDAGQNIVVTGGQYSSNGQDPTAPAVGAGIAVLGGSQVTIVGADCSGVNELWKATVPGPLVQPYGISVASGVADVIVDGCNLTNNKTLPLYVLTTGTDLRVTDCAGYNDQTKIVTSVVPGSPFSGSSLGYYGPVTFYATGSLDLSLSIGSGVLPFTNGTFTLGPRASADYTISELGHTWTGFVMIGQ